MRNLVPIGRFSRLCRLTIPALRHYDELGLLRPAAVDADTGYRYYSHAQAWDAERIRVLRSVEMPLDEIRAVLCERDPVAVRARLEQHRHDLETRIAGYRDALAHLDHLIAEETGDMQYDVRVREDRAQPIVSLRDRTSLAQMASFWGSAYGEVFRAIAEQGARPAGPPFSIYHDPEFRDDDIDVEVGVPVDEAVVPGGRLVGRTLDGGPVAYTLHVGSYEEIGAAYRAVSGWIQAHGHTMSGAPREVYLVGPGQAPDPSGYRTEIVWPLG
jgi:DNA-binding transcriptional MerR regulator